MIEKLKVDVWSSEKQLKRILIRFIFLTACFQLRHVNFVDDIRCIHVRIHNVNWQ